MTRALGRAGMLLVLALLFAAPAAASHVQCGDTITQDTTLDSDLTCAGDGITISGTGVTLDLAGHTIQGSAGFSAGVRLLEPVDPHVLGGTIRGFYQGVAADGPVRPFVDDMVLEGNEWGFYCNYTSGCRIEDSVVRGNGTGALMVSADAGQPEGGIIRRNVFEANGVGVQLSGYPASVAENRIVDNQGHGLVVDYYGDAHVTQNVIAGNGGSGMVVYYIGRATIERNRIEGNADDGIYTDRDSEFGAVTAVVNDNRVDRNGDDGIDVDWGQDVVVSRNRAFFNVDLGIEAAVGTTDGGGNKARHNGNPAQCAGVSCK